MERIFSVARTNAGAIVPSASVRVNLAGTATLATLYSDNSYTPQANPFTSEADGAYQFYAQNGRYDIILTKTGFTFDDDDTANVILDDPSGAITPAQIIANQNDYGPTNAINQVTWRISSDAHRTLTGLVAGYSQQHLALTNVGSFTIMLMHESSSSVAANRITSPFSANHPILPNATAHLIYDSTTTRWRLLDVPPNILTRNSTATTVSSSIVETTVFTYSLPGNLLGTTGRVKVTLHGQYTANMGVNRTGRVRLKYGGTTIGDSFAALVDTNLTSVWIIEGFVMASGATNTQEGSVMSTVRSGTGATSTNAVYGARGTAAIDSTASQTLAVTIELDLADANVAFTMSHAALELLV